MLPTAWTARGAGASAQRQVRASFIGISLIRFEQVANIPFAKHNYIVQAIPPDRTDQPTSRPTSWSLSFHLCWYRS